MGKDSAIEWCDHTFNPWIGCTKVSPGCDHCYAETLATRRLGVAWGPHAPRRRTAPSTWALPLRWNRQAFAAGNRPRVFCASLADVFDNQVPIEWFLDLLVLIQDTPSLQWLLLTKRPQNIMRQLGTASATAEHFGGDHLAGWIDSWRDGNPPPHVALGTTAEDQNAADLRLPLLRKVPAALRYVSFEPLIGPINALAHLGKGIDWAIVGGETGQDARPMHPAWERMLREQCAVAGTAYFRKQWGDWKHQPERAHFKELAREPWRRVESLLPGVRPALMFRVGKKAAGAELDGQRHRAFPAIGHG